MNDVFGIVRQDMSKHDSLLHALVDPVQIVGFEVGPCAGTRRVHVFACFLLPGPAAIVRNLG